MTGPEHEDPELALARALLELVAAVDRLDALAAAGAKLEPADAELLRDTGTAVNAYLEESEATT